MVKKLSKQIIPAILVLALFVTIPVNVYASEFEFEDVTPKHRYYNEIKNAYSKGYIEAKKDNIIGLDEPFTRADMASAIVLMTKAKVFNFVDDFPFTDVTQDNTYHSEIAWIANAGVMNGYGNGTFGPDNTITFEQMAIVLQNICQHISYRVPKTIDIPEVVNVSFWAEDATVWALRAGFFEKEALYRNFVTTQDAAVILTRLERLRPIVVAPNKVYNDLDEMRPEYMSIQWALDEGIIEGRSDEQFVPFAAIFQGEFLNMLAEFKDVNLTQYDYSLPIDNVDEFTQYHTVFAWAYDVGLIPNKVDPYKKPSFQEIFSFLYKSFGIYEGDYDIDKFDLTEVDEEYLEAYTWALSLGLGELDYVRVFSPIRPVSRADACIIFARLGEFID